VRAGDSVWRIENRGALDTLRFDEAANLHVDYARSRGVIGHTRTNGSLYVALDSADASPVLAMSRGVEPAASAIVLNDSRWRIHTAARDGKAVTFRAEGFGDGEMRWRAAPGTYKLSWRSAAGRKGAQRSSAGADGLATFRIPSEGANDVQVRIEPDSEVAKTQ
jgi:hypothetical protein